MKLHDNGPGVATRRQIIVGGATSAITLAGKRKAAAQTITVTATVTVANTTPPQAITDATFNFPIYKVLKAGVYVLTIDFSQIQNPNSFDIICFANGYNTQTLLWQSPPAPGAVSFQLTQVKADKTKVNISTSVNGATVTANVSLVNPPTYQYNLAIDWGEVTSIGVASDETILGPNATNGTASHTYTKSGTYLVSAVVNETSPHVQPGEFISTVQVSISLPVQSSLWTAFIANNNTAAVLVCSSPNAAIWTGNTDTLNYSGLSPSIVKFNNRLYVAFIANDSSNRILVASSADGTTWTGGVFIDQYSTFSPSLTVFNNKIYVAFIATNGGGILVCSSADGTTWSANTAIGQWTNYAPSLAAFNNKLYVAFIATNGGGILACSSADGTTWSANTAIGQWTNYAPSLAAFNNKLYVAFIATNGGGILACSSADGTTWSANTAIGQWTNYAPSLAAFNNKLYVAFIATNGGGILVCSSADGTTWSANTAIGQWTNYAPSLA